MSSMTPSRLGRLLFVCAVAATIHGAARADGALVVTASDLVIAARGRAPKYDIVIPAKPTVWQRHAASELRKWTKELTGVELAICEGKGEAFQALVNVVDGKPKLDIGPKAEDIRSEDYEWYDLGTFRPAPGDMFEFGSGRFTNGGGHGAVKAVYLDRIEISRVGK